MGAAVGPKIAPKLENRGAARRAKILAEMCSVPLVRNSPSSSMDSGEILDSGETFERSYLSFGRLRQPSASPLLDLHQLLLSHLNLSLPPHSPSLNDRNSGSQPCFPSPHLLAFTSLSPSRSHLGLVAGNSDDNHADDNNVSDSRVEEKKVQEERDGELVLDGGFVVPKSKESDAPDMNFLGHSFRDYENGESERHQGVAEFYRMQHIHQTYDYVKQMRKEYGKLNKMKMSIWECCELLNNVVDESDLDLDEPQIQHLLQTAEAIRRDYPDEDWLHLTALIHDLGKVMLLPEFGGLPQWAVVGDTFPVGCTFDSANIHHKYFKENPDKNNPKYKTKNGVYREGCGLDNVHMSWGHDDYMYLVAKENGTTLPHAGLFIIRYHSFYPLHKAGAYTHLMNNEDKEDLKWLHVFNNYDLYSKSKVHVDVEQVKPYYISLINKYFPAKLNW